MRRIGKYEVRGFLGRGQMARVYKVAEPVIGKIGALKRLEPHPSLAALMGEARLQDLFVQEARTMAGLRHPNLVSILDFDTAGGAPFYVMEFHAVNLGDLIGEAYRPDRPSRILRLDRAVQYAFQTLDGLARLHFDNVIHRDIKPFNLLLTAGGRVRIGDFGLSTLRGERFDAPGNLKVGSPFYAAPEQETAPDAVGPEADLFSVGVMLRRMLTGKLSSSGADPPSQSNPDLNPAWDAFFEKAAAQGPVDRFSSAGQMKTALEALYEDWKIRQERICKLPEPKPAHAVSQNRLRCRRIAVKVRPSAARTFFSLDPLWRPRRFRANRLRSAADGAIFDEATGLLWEQAGSPYPVTWKGAKRHVAELNRRKPPGKAPWRLPTVDELTTLLSTTPHGADFCLDPVFDSTQRWLWSCDRCSFISAWYVDAELGFVHRQDFDAPFYARGVRG
ncbi:MAG: protein kinase [Desulfobacterales bacterium]|nr:protein kinase [Desulfobacterales bacterium]